MSDQALTISDNKPPKGIERAHWSRWRVRQIFRSPGSLGHHSVGDHLHMICECDEVVETKPYVQSLAAFADRQDHHYPIFAVDSRLTEVEIPFGPKLMFRHSDSPSAARLTDESGAYNG